MFSITLRVIPICHSIVLSQGIPPLWPRSYLPPLTTCVAPH